MRYEKCYAKRTFFDREMSGLGDRIGPKTFFSMNYDKIHGKKKVFGPIRSPNPDISRSNNFRFCVVKNQGFPYK